MEEKDVEIKPAIVSIKGKEYSLKFTVGFWRVIKEQCDITQNNLEAKLNENFGLNAAQVIYWGIYYGLLTPGECPVTIEDIERELEKNVMDSIEQAIINGMTKAERRIVKTVRDAQEKKYRAFEEENLETKKA